MGWPLPALKLEGRYTLALLGRGARRKKGGDGPGRAPSVGVGWGSAAAGGARARGVGPARRQAPRPGRRRPGLARDARAYIWAGRGGPGAASAAPRRAAHRTHRSLPWCQILTLHVGISGAGGVSQ
jgi:hypothetical protein